MNLTEARKKVKVVQKIITEFTLVDTMTESCKKSTKAGVQVDSNLLCALEQRRKRFLNQLDNLLK